MTILIENMRREGYELAVSRPRVLYKEVDGVKMEPYESLTVDVEENHQGPVMEELGRRRVIFRICSRTVKVALDSNTRSRHAV